jgi:hypothetical protein
VRFRDVLTATLLMVATFCAIAQPLGGVIR